MRLKFWFWERMRELRKICKNLAFGISLMSSATHVEPPWSVQWLSLAREFSIQPFSWDCQHRYYSFSGCSSSYHEMAAMQIQKFLLVGQRWDMEYKSEIMAGSQQFSEFRRSCHLKEFFIRRWAVIISFFQGNVIRKFLILPLGALVGITGLFLKAALEGWPVIDAPMI